MSVAGFDSDTWSDDPFLPSKFSGFFKKRNLNNETCSEGVTKSGAWCLQSSSPPNYVKLDKSSYELPMGHVRADRAIANYILSLMLVGSNVIDLGAGVGQYGKFIIDKNPKLANQYQAFDGALNVETFTDGFVKNANLGVVQELPVADWVVSLEVGEHIDHTMERDYIHNLHMSNRKGILLSWGVLHQKGNHHVNNHSPNYIHKKFSKLGYTLDTNKTLTLRNSVDFDWFRKSVYVFRR